VMEAGTRSVGLAVPFHCLHAWISSPPSPCTYIDTVTVMDTKHCSCPFTRRVEEEGRICLLVYI
jgi:hypothetical protein